MLHPLGVIVDPPTPPAIDYEIRVLEGLFCKYVPESKDRVKILVDTGLLRQPKVDIFPFHLELAALRSAKSPEQRHMLWDAIMPYLPESKRKPNPFPGPNTNVPIPELSQMSGADQWI